MNATVPQGGGIAIASEGVAVLFVIVILLSVAVLLHHVATEQKRRAQRLRFESVASTIVPALIKDPRTLEREIAIARLRCGDAAVALVLRKLRLDLKGGPANHASRILEEIGATGRLVEDAKSRREWKRLVAVRALGECGGPAAVNALAAAARHDTSEAVRNAAREGLLWNRADDDAAVAVESFMASRPQQTGARQTFYMLLAIASESRITALVRSGELPPAELKLALEAVGDAGRRTAIALAKDQVMSEDPELRATAVRVIGKTGAESEIRVAIDALDDDEWFVRAAAARSLEWLLAGAAEVGGATLEARERLAQHLGDPSWWVRANAARALAAAGDDGVRLLRDADSRGEGLVRDAARAMLAIVTTVPLYMRTAAVEAIPSHFDPDLTIGERTFRPGGLRA